MDRHYSTTDPWMTKNEIRTAARFRESGIIPEPNLLQAILWALSPGVQFLYS